MKSKFTRREFLVSSAVFTAGISMPSLLYGKVTKGMNDKFHFVVASDTHVHDGHYCHAFDYITCKAIMENHTAPGDFIVINGDMDPFARAKKIIDDKLINPLKQQGIDFGFYPGIGNHDLYNTGQVKEYNTDISEKTQTRAIINYNKTHLKNIVNWGPEFSSKLIGYENNGSKYTTYSFDHKNSHFVVLDLYYANSIPGRGNGNFNKETEAWLIKDLKENKKKNIFVFGHQPTCFYKPHSGKKVPDGDYINSNKERLQHILEKYRVKIYFSGHTHKFGWLEKNGITYINTGKSMTPDGNTYVMVFVNGEAISYTLYNYNKKWKKYSHEL